MAALKSDYLRSILLCTSIWKPLGSRAPLASHWCSIDFTGSWKSLGVSWKRLGGLLKALGVSWELLAASWDLLENRRPSFQNHPQNHPESTRKPSKIRPKTLQKLGLEGIVLRIAFGPFFLSDLWASWAVSGASWDHLGAVLGRLAASWSRPGTTSGRSWAVLGASWGVLAHLGGVLGAS